MKRDVRLQHLSREHHHALALARLVTTHAERGTLDAGVLALVEESFVSEIGPHFDEEEILLDGLLGHGVDELVAHTRDDHARLRLLLASASDDDTTPLAELARLLTEHVRFEERELYPACEERVPSALLDQLASAHARGARGAADPHEGETR